MRGMVRWGGCVGSGEAGPLRTADGLDGAHAASATALAREDNLVQRLGGHGARRSRRHAAEEGRREHGDWRS